VYITIKKLHVSGYNNNLQQITPKRKHPLTATTVVFWNSQDCVSKNYKFSSKFPSW